MIYVANNTREIEKNNLNLKMNISKISENLKINKIELAAHQNSSYLKTLYELYFYKTQNNKYLAKEIKSPILVPPNLTSLFFVWKFKV